MNVFNASITVTELLTKTLENCAKELASRCVKECAAKYGFDAEAEIRMLGLENLSLIKKQMAKKTAGAKKAKAPKAPKAPKEKKSTFPLPFIKDLVNISGCQGLAYNKGLFTQCDKKRMENGEFCKSCQSEADKNASGSPDCGNVCDRIVTGLYEFKDPKGRSPTRYVKVLEKLKLNETDAMEEANKLNINLDYEHFVVEEQKKSKGRPKKASSVVEAENVTDLFAKLTVDVVENSESESESVSVKSKKSKLTDEEKAEKKAKLEADREAKKAEREAAKAAEKEEKKAKLEAEKEAKKAEKEAKIAAEKAEREAKRLKEKEEKAAAKAAEKKPEKGKKASKAKVEEKVEEPEPETKTKVTKFLYNGVNYLKSKDHVVYTLKGEEVGVWDPNTGELSIIEDEDEEEEEEYDEEL